MRNATCADSKTRLERQAVRFNLTPRETQVVNLLAIGQPWKDVAARLGISIFTIYFHVKNVRRKLQCANLAAIVNKLLA